MMLTRKALKPSASYCVPHGVRPQTTLQPHREVSFPRSIFERRSHESLLRDAKYLHTCSSLPAEAQASVTSRSPASGAKKIGVLFVCLGNICRSPTAEAMFRAVVERNGMADKFEIDSCGTGGGSPDWYMEGGWSYHEGDASDSRMTATAQKRGVILTSRSRPLKPLDLTKFDYIVGMDPKNTRAMQEAADYWAGRKGSAASVPADYRSKLSLMTLYCRKYKGATEVPDPYYGGPEGFEKVLDLLDDACEGLLEVIRGERGL